MASSAFRRNPWATPVPEPLPPPPPDPDDHGRLAVMRRPRPTPGSGGLPVAAARDAVEHRPWWWVPAHGGAGVSTLETLVPGAPAHERAWPTSASGVPCRVVLVARSHASGLRAAQAAARQWASGGAPVDLLGLVVVADAPGRRPRPLREMARLVSGAVPRRWDVGWVEAWRLGAEPDPACLPKDVARLAADLELLTPPRRTP